MAGALVNAHHGLPGRPGRQAEDLAHLRIEPGPGEMDALVGLDREVALVRFPELLSRHPDEATVNIHERRHARASCGQSGRAARSLHRTFAGVLARVIGRPTDEPARA